MPSKTPRLSPNPSSLNAIVKKKQHSPPETLRLPTVPWSPSRQDKTEVSEEAYSQHNTFTLSQVRLSLPLSLSSCRDDQTQTQSQLPLHR